MTRFITHWCIWLALSLMLIVTPLVTAHAAVCAPREVMLAKIYAQYSEVPVGGGVAGSGAVNAELLIAAETGSWTLIVTDTNGVSCVLAGGQAWEFAVQEEKKGQGT